MSEALDSITAELDAGSTSPQLLVLLYNAISDAADRGNAGELVAGLELEGSPVRCRSCGELLV